MPRTYNLLLAVAKKAFGLQRPERNLEVFADDTFIVSYPKSGNTWTRFLIANMVYPEQPVNFKNINELIPDIYEIRKRDLAKVRRPRIIKSHEYFEPRYGKVMYIVRDPRDVALSQFHFKRKRRVVEDSLPMETFVAGFLAGETSSYGSWGENVASWLATRGRDQDFLLLRYEDMLESPMTELAKVASFLHIDASPQRLARAVEFSSADRMRGLERVQAGQWSLTRNTRQDIPFVRTARAGDWRTELPQHCVAQIEHAWGFLMQYLNYPLMFATTPAGNPAPETTLLGRGGSL